MTRFVAALPITLAACGPWGQPPEEEIFGRAVVLAEHPLSLANAQTGVVTWPVWGGSTTLDEPVAVRVTFDPTVGDSGLLFAGPCVPGGRNAFELRSIGGTWFLRERLGFDAIQEVALDAPSVVDFVLEIDTNGESVRAVWNGGDATIDLQNAITAPGGVAGLYATLDVGAELVISDLAMSAPLPTHPELGTPLRDLTDASDVQIGSAIDVWPPRADLGFESLLGEQFDTSAPVEFYWPTTRGEDRDWFFVPADMIVNYATVHDQSITGMFLVWDYALPQWVKDVAQNEGAAALQAVYDEHVTTLASRYAGRVDAWVVVNEAIWWFEDDGRDPRFARTFWKRWLGEEHIERAFHLARAADPNAVLMYNEFGVEVTNPKSDFLYDMVVDFQTRGVPIDAIGFQFHVHAGDPPDMAEVQTNFERFAALGLDLYITELDVSLEGIEDPDELELQAQIYGDLLETCQAVPACRSYTMFGFTDKYAWDELGDATPLIFTDDYEAKPAYFEIQSILSAP